MENSDKDKFPKIKPPSKEKVDSAAMDKAMEDPNIRKLIEDGYGVFIDRDTGEVKIIEKPGEESKKDE